MIGLTEVAVSCALVAIAIYLYNISKQSFWKKLNVDGPKPVPIFGNFLDVIVGKTSLHELFRDFYVEWKHKPFIGLYQGTNPVLFLSDPELIKHVLIKDFSTFTDRGFVINEKADPLTANLFMIEGHRWKGLRNRLSPVFTSGKLKRMYHLLTECAEHFGEFMEGLLAKGNTVEVRDATAKFTTDVIGSCAFGLNLNSFSSEESDFRKIGERVFRRKLTDVMKDWLREMLPAVFKLLQIKLVAKEHTEFFMKIIAETIDYRKKTGIVRHDFIHLMTQLRDTTDENDFELTDELLAAQAFIFFLAGFETSSTTASFALYELGQNKEIQDKLRSEIRDVLNLHDGHLPYEAVKDLKYLDKVFQETLRKHPPASNLIRMAVKNYTIPESKVKIPAGTKVFMSILGLHHDPRYFPEPDLFDPERFSEESIRQRPQMVYLPFGEGPRNCIGSRFAVYQTKVAIVQLIKSYEIKISPKMKVPYKIEKKVKYLRLSAVFT